MNRPTPSAVEAALPIFQFSHDPGDITTAALSILSGSSVIDPLVTIRGLIARLDASVPPAIVDPDEIVAFEREREQARSQIVKRIIRHLRELAKVSEADWRETPEDVRRHVLSGSMEATAMLSSAASSVEPAAEHFREALRSFLTRVQKFPSLRSAWESSKASGPLLIAVAYVVTSELDAHDRELVKGYLKELVPGDFRAALQAWAATESQRAALVMRVQASATETAIEPICIKLDHLSGALNAVFSKIQSERWALLKTLVESMNAGLLEEAAELRLQANDFYSEFPQWPALRSAIGPGKHPNLEIVDGIVCNRCSISVPETQKAVLRRGEPVICQSCRSILLFKGQP